MKIRIYLILRRFVRHPWQMLLGITGIALGVAVVLAIDLTNASSERAFMMANQSVAGDITHRITSSAGFIDESYYADLRMQHGLRRLMPLVEGRVRTAAGEQYRLLGFDPVAATDFSQARSLVPPGRSALTLIQKPGTVFITPRMQRMLHAGTGTTIEVSAKGSSHTLTIAGIIPKASGLPGQALGDVMITDIATAQDVLGMQGRLSRIDLVLDSQQTEMLSNLLKPPLQLVTSEARSNAMTQMTRAFRINLTALSLLALVIGGFLIYNTMTISVLQRREFIATVRTLGLKRRELFSLILGEALLLAVVGLLAGYLLGIGLSHYLIKLAARTINDLYFTNEINSIYLNGWSFAKATLLGLGATLLATYFPVRDAMAVAPELTRSRSRLERRVKFSHRRYIIAAVLFALTAVLILLLSGKNIIAGFAALAFIILAFAMLSPALLVLLTRLARPLLNAAMGLAGSIAGRGVLSSLSRTQVAVTALAVAISATIGVSIMISSFRVSVQDWLSWLLTADVYISMADSDPAPGIEPKLLEAIREQPGVERVATASWRNLWRKDDQVELLVRNIDNRIFSGYRFRDPDNSERWRLFSTTDSVIVSEPYAYHNNVSTGDTIELPTDRGKHGFKVVGVYVDYSSDHGIISMYRKVYNRWWNDRLVSSISLYLDPALDSRDFVAGLDNGLLAGYNLTVRPNRSLRELSMQIFDRTFVITEVLRVVTFVIAFIGILGALLAIQLERDREFAVLRTCGMTPWGLRKLVLTESGLMGMIAGFIAMPLGVTLAAVLIFVINRRSFGWTMDFVLSPQYLISAIVLGVVAGVLAGIYPAWRMAAVSPSTALHYE